MNRTVSPWKMALAVTAIFLANAASSASPSPTFSFNLDSGLLSKAKGELLNCPVPYSNEHCATTKPKDICEPQNTAKPLCYSNDSKKKSSNES